MWRLGLALAGLIVLLPPEGAAQPTDEAGRTRFRVTPPSIVGFDAQATQVGAFSGETRDVQGEIFVDLSALGKGVRGTITVNAASLKTGIGLRDSDLLAVMDTGRYPVIRFTVTEVQSPKPTLGPGDQAAVTVTGTLEIHGVPRTVRVPATVTAGPRRLEVRGRFPLRMTEYGIQPPRVFFFIRVQDQVEVSFTLVGESSG